MMVGRCARRARRDSHFFSFLTSLGDAGRQEGYSTSLVLLCGLELNSSNV